MNFGEENTEKIFDANELINKLESVEVENEENRSSFNVKFLILLNF